MKFNEIVEKISAKRGGTLFRITYSTIPTASAKAREDGVVVRKITSKTVRTGVSYANMSGISKDRSESTNHWCHWELKNRILKHNTEEKYYVSVADIKKNSNTVTKWYINDIEVCLNDVKNSGYVIPSYFSRSGESKKQSINFENIIEIG